MDLGAVFTNLASGQMLLAVPVALLAGLVAFFSPCVLPLLPGYLSYATGMSAAEVTSGKAGKGRMLAGSALFVLGFALVFTIAGVAISTLGGFLQTQMSLIYQILGVIMIIVGLIFGGWIPFGQSQLRFKQAPQAGLIAAPILGALFGIGWTPCIGPTLQVVLTMAFSQAEATRGGILAFTYALGLGIPFLITGLAFTQMTRVISVIRKHTVAMQRIGGALMIITGIAMVSGLWRGFISWLQQFLIFLPAV